MVTVENLGKTEEYVYDISLDGTVVNALGLNVISNTDGMNFALPDKYQYTEENPYVSTGLNRNTKEGNIHIGFDADVAEFNDLYMRGKNGLGIDEVLLSSVNLSRKNYLDLFEDHSVKSVGNTVKSKKMPLYIKEFLAQGVPMLLNDKGKDFLELYYDTIDNLYNRRIGVDKICSIGKIKTSIETYKEKCNTVTKSGSKRSRQAWYELVIKHNKSVDMGDSVYYVNTGSKKTDSDIKRISVCYDQNGNDVTKQVNKEYKLYTKLQGSKKELSLTDWVSRTMPNVRIVDELLFNCVMIDPEVPSTMEGVEYNIVKYIEQFNNRVKALFVVFKKDFREGVDKNGNTILNKLIISDPKDRPYLNEEDCVLCSNEPFNEIDQDYYEDVMIPEDKEISFWLRVNKRPPYIDECGLDWEEICRDYEERLVKYNEEFRLNVVNTFVETFLKLTKEDKDDITLGGIMPQKLSKEYTINRKNKHITHIESGIKICTIYDLTEVEGADDSIEDVEF